MYDISWNWNAYFLTSNTSTVKYNNPSHNSNQLAEKVVAVIYYAIEFLQLRFIKGKMLTNIPPLSLGKKEEYHWNPTKVNQTGKTSATKAGNCNN